MSDHDVDPNAVIEATGAPADRPVETLSVGDLPPPEPLRRTLKRLEALDEEPVLIQLNDRAPQHLFPTLDERGYDYATTDLARRTATAIWRP